MYVPYLICPNPGCEAHIRKTGLNGPNRFPVNNNRPLRLHRQHCDKATLEERAYYKQKGKWPNKHRMSKVQKEKIFGISTED